MNTFTRYLIFLVVTSVLIPTAVGLVVIVHEIDTLLLRNQASVIVELLVA